MTAYEQLLEHIDKLWIVDTHEHLPNEADRPAGVDVLGEWLTHYFSCDLISAGLSDQGLDEARDASKDLMARWAIVEPYWNAARSTGYGRSLDLAARGIYGVDGVSRATIGPLNEAFGAARQKGGHYQRVLKDLGRIAVSIVDKNLQADPNFFVAALRLDDFIMPTHRREIRAKGESLNIRIHNLDDWKEAMRLQLEKSFATGAVCLKSGLAYVRSLHYEKASAADAEREFNELFREGNSPDWRGAIKVGKALQDHMMHAVLRLADQKGLTFQFHTGLQEGNGNIIDDSDPARMTNLFLEYENVKFDIFHMGYPFMMKLSNLAKNFRNVFIDMCWGNIISPAAARGALAEWLDAVPANKISAFGGDYCFVDGVYGHQKLARQNVAAALSSKVDAGDMDIGRALEIAGWLFVDNPRWIFGLPAGTKK